MSGFPKVENVEKTFRVNILQMIYLSKEVVPHMKRGGSIINTTSVTAYAVRFLCFLLPAIGKILLTY